MAANPNTNFTAGQVLTADQANRWPRGVMNYASLTGGLAGFSGGAADVTGTSMTFTAVANRLYKATWKVNGTKNASGLDLTFVQFTTSANVVLSDLSVSSPSGNYNLNLCGSVLFTVAAGSVTYKLRIGSFSGTFTATASATNPVQLVIEDLGPI